MKLLHETDSCRIEYDATNQLLAFTLIGFLPSVDLRAAYEEALRTTRRYEVRRWLNDFSQMRAVRQADQDWLVRDFTPRLIISVGATLQRSAMVLSTDAMNQLFASDVVERTSPTRSWQFRLFSTRPEALAWLLPPAPNAAGNPLG